MKKLEHLKDIKTMTSRQYLLQQVPGRSIKLYEIKSKNQLTWFLDSKIKTSEQDCDGRWITTWDYLGPLKYFFIRMYNWMRNYDDRKFGDIQFSNWQTHDFVRIKKKKINRISPYLVTELSKEKT